MIAASLFAVALLAPQQSSDWVQLDGPTYAGIQTSYDRARGRAVIVGSEGETWEFDGTTRLQRANLGASKPVRRARASMGTDATRGITLFFSGSELGVGAAPMLVDTWTWNGSAWTEIATNGVHPPGRFDGVLGFDPARDRFVLFGGQGDNRLLRDTWEYDHATGWVEISTSTRPASSRGRMVYDSARGVLVLIASQGVLNRPMLVYEFDGTDWTQRVGGGPSWPLTRSNMSVAYDELRGVTVMIGGTYYGDEIWEYDGVRFRFVHLLSAPWRIDAPAWFDDALGAVVVFGGTTIVPTGGQISHSDAHVWDGTSFAPLWGERSPSPRFGEKLFADPDSGEITIASTLAAVSDTWRWDGNDWEELAPANQLPVRGSQSFTFDTARGLGLVFGGSTNAFTYFDELWAWDGSDWSELAATTRPQPRASAGMCFDTDRGVAIVFGGSDGPLFPAPNFRNDTWEWDGAAWSYVPTASAPFPRERAALGYDEARGVTVLFGGRIGATAADQLGDTWEYDGVTWIEVVSPQSPPNLLGPRFLFDPMRGRLVLAGLRVTGIAAFDLELWEYDGSWSPIDTDGDANRGGTNLYWDAARQRIMLYDGLTVRAWTDTPANAAAYGTGCGSDPRMTVRARARPGEDQFGFEARVAPGQPTLFAAGLVPANIPLRGGCTLHVFPLSFTFAQADSRGTATSVFGLPDDPALVGLKFYAQAAALGSKKSGLWGVSPGVEVVIGD